MNDDLHLAAQLHEPERHFPGNFKTAAKATALLLCLAQEATQVIRRLTHNNEVLTNALWKACGDDETLVKETIESQGELK